MSTTTLNRPAQEPTTPPAATAWVPTTADRCDACGAQAYVRVVLAAGVLFFCAHHGREHAERLAQVAVSVQDESARLLDEGGLTTAV